MFSMNDSSASLSDLGDDAVHSSPAPRKKRARSSVKRRVSVTSTDTYRGSSNPKMKLKCNDLVNDMLLPYLGERFVILDGSDALTCRTLLAAGHDLRQSVVINYTPETVTSIRAKVGESVLVIEGDLVNRLEQWPSGLPFSGGWLDFCGSPSHAIAAFTILFQRSLVSTDASFAVSWCTRTGRANAFPGESHQQSLDAESAIAQLAEDAGYALIKLPGAATYRNMYFWSFRLRRCTFTDATVASSSSSSSNVSRGSTSVVHCALHKRVQAAFRGDEYVVERILPDRRWSIVHNHWECLVQWEGWSEPTWEPESMMRIDCPTLFDNNNTDAANTDTTNTDTDTSTTFTLTPPATVSVNPSESRNSPSEQLSLSPESQLAEVFVAVLPT